MERLRQFAQGNRLRVAAADLTGVIPLMVVSDYLTEIARRRSPGCCASPSSTWPGATARPQGVQPGETGLLVLGYGKLGGIELGYGSDLDLVFLHGSDSVSGMTRAPSHQPRAVLRPLGQRMIHMMTTRTTPGILYEVDMRLRPDGNKGMLVRSLTAFADYQAARRLDLGAPGPGAGPPGGRATGARRALRRDPPGHPLPRAGPGQAARGGARDARPHAREPRQGPRRALRSQAGTGRYCRYRVYGSIRGPALGVAYPDLADWTDNIRLLETLGRHRLLPGGGRRPT
jgi:[glutamine synthetase] adenylyltransferase / [glutamine synthetase]-adenylyl-L-tyrosine phosphorylase